MCVDRGKINCKEKCLTNFDFYLQECKLDIYKLKFKKKLINNKLKFGVNMKMKGEVQRDVDSQINHVVRFVQEDREIHAF